MLFYNHFNDSNVLLFSYMFIYNTSLITLFWTLFGVVTTKFKTLQSFSGFSFNAFYLTLTTILLFSMAGVPPFIGFFSKLFILTLITNNSFFLLYTIFFVVLFLGLYFYIQNIRFLHSTNKGEVDYTYLTNNERVIPIFYYSSLLVLTLVIFGAVYIEDILLLFIWILL